MNKESEVDFPDAILDGLLTVEGVGNWLNMAGEYDVDDALARYNWAMCKDHPWIGLRISFSGVPGTITFAIAHPRGYINFDVVFDEAVCFDPGGWPRRYTVIAPPGGIEAYRRAEHRIRGTDIQRLGSVL